MCDNDKEVNIDDIDKVVDAIDIDREWEDFKRIPVVAEFLRNFTIPMESEEERRLREEDDHTSL